MLAVSTRQTKNKNSWFNGTACIGIYTKNSKTCQIKMHRWQPVSWRLHYQYVCAGAIRRNMVGYRLTRSKNCMTFQAPTLASHGMLTAACVFGVWRKALHHISRDFNRITFIARVCRMVTCASWKMKYDVYTKLSKLFAIYSASGLGQHFWKKSCTATVIE